MREKRDRMQGIYRRQTSNQGLISTNGENQTAGLASSDELKSEVKRVVPPLAGARGTPIKGGACQGGPRVRLVGGMVGRCRPAPPIGPSSRRGRTRNSRAEDGPAEKTRVLTVPKTQMMASRARAARWRF